MKTIKPLTSLDPKKLLIKINDLANESNRHKEEIRQLKSKLRVNAHYHRV